MDFCTTCGQLTDPESAAKRRDIYDRIGDGRSTWEPLVYTSADLEEVNFYGGDEDDVDAVMLSMERNMHERGLCVKCGLPDLRGVREEDVMTEEEAQEMHEMWAEQAAERRAGC